LQAANKHNASLQSATKSVHEETVRIVDEQMKDISHQMQALDDFVTRARSQNAQHHDVHSKSLRDLLDTVRSSYGNIGTHFTSTYDRVKGLGDEMSLKTNHMNETLSHLDPTLCQPLAELRSNITMTTLHEYVPTGETPQKVQYQYPTELPRTEAHETLLAALRRPGSASASTERSSPMKIPVVFNDMPTPMVIDSDDTTSVTTSFSGTTSFQTSVIGSTPTNNGGLREIDANIHAGSLNSGDSTGTVSVSSDASSKVPLFKRSTTGTGIRPPSRGVKKSLVVPAEGRENTIPSFSQSTGRRRSPRTG
jgi:kinesin family protein 11